jgi:hypothetical protein
MNPIYIEVEAEVRYWEDASVNGQEDTDGKLMPFRFGKSGARSSAWMMATSSAGQKE